MVAGMEYQPVIGDDRPFFFGIHKGFFNYGTHWHSELELCYCLSGAVSIKVEGCEYTLTTGELLIINSAETHDYRNLSEDTAAIVIEFGYKFLGSEFAQIAAGYSLHRTITIAGDPAYADLESVFNRLSVLYMTRLPTGRWMICSALFELAADIARLVPFNSQNVPQTIEARRRRVLNMLPTVDMIHEKYMEQLSLDDMASAQGYEKNSFCRAFRTAMGISPHSYLNKYRIEQAQHLLRIYSLPVSRIAEMCGIPEPKSFCRVFMQYTGMTPTEYRAKVQNAV